MGTSTKAHANFKKHGIAFEVAIKVFDDRHERTKHIRVWHRKHDFKR